MEGSNVVSAAAVMAAPHRALPRLLHLHQNGRPRAYLNSNALADLIHARRIVVDDVVLPWRPALDTELADVLLAGGPDAFESSAHKILKVHARLLALAFDPAAALEPEAPVSQERYPLRADLVAKDAFGASQSFECGATDGRSVMTQLNHGQLRVTVLPYATLAGTEIRAFSFRLAANQALPGLDVTDGVRAWDELLNRCRFSAPTLCIG